MKAIHYHKSLVIDLNTRHLTTVSSLQGGHAAVDHVCNASAFPTFWQDRHEVPELEVAHGEALAHLPRPSNGRGF